MKARQSQCLPHIWQMVVQRGSWSGTHMPVLKYEVDCNKWWKRGVILEQTCSCSLIQAWISRLFINALFINALLFINRLQSTWTIHWLAQVELWSILSYNGMHRMWQVFNTKIWNKNKVFIYTSVCLLWETHNHYTIRTYSKLAYML